MRDEAAPQQRQRHKRAAAQATRQWGNITRFQLSAAGFTVAEIRGMVDRGALHQQHRGVYSLGHRSPAAEARWAAGLLAAGPTAVLAGTSAAALYGLMPIREITEVTAPTRGRGGARLTVHCCHLDPADVCYVKGLRVTTIPRMLLDLAAARWPIDSMTQQAAASGLISLDDLRAYAAGHAHARGGPRLLAAVHRPHTRSRGEKRMLAYLRRSDLPLPEMNAQIGRLTVDALFPELGLAVELDYEQTHGTAHAARDDEWRDRYLRARELDLLRIGEDDFAVLAVELRRRSGRV